ncbi:transposable element Tcb1 transposase [Trichonephila clavipes]|nr:transposable element Tcb1 transposase [Trichonephila clavipes]
MLEKVIENWTSRLDYIRASGGSPMPEIIFKIKQRSAFDQVSEFDRGRIVAYRDCGLSFRKIGSRVGRNKQLVCAYHSTPFTADWSVRKTSIACLPLTQNHIRLRHQWCEEKRMWEAEWNEVVSTDESRICLQPHDARIRVCTHCRYLNHQRYISEVLVPVVLPYLQGLNTAIFQQDNARSHMAHIVQRFFVNPQIELLLWQARSPDLSPIENMWSMVAQRLNQITPPAATPDQLLQRVEAAWSAVP